MGNDGYEIDIEGINFIEKAGEKQCDLCWENTEHVIADMNGDYYWRCTNCGDMQYKEDQNALS